MKLNDDFYLRNIFDEHILVYTGADPANADGLFTLNETGAFILSALKETDDINEIARRLAAEYETDEATAAEDVAEYIEILKKSGVILD